MRIVPLTDFLERFETMTEVMVGDELLQIESCRYHKQDVLMKFREYPVREDAMRLTGRLLTVARSEAAPLEAGEFYTFNKIVLPIMKPALAVQAIFSFVASWNNYFIPALVLDTADKKTLPILIAQLRSADFLKFDMGKVYMMVAIAILPVIVVYLLLSKFIVRGVALGGVKG